jgi:cytochrome c biogenesis protein CcdA
MSLIGALTPLVKVAPRSWIWSVLAYTLSGAASAWGVGALVGWAGHVVGAKACCWAVVPLAIVLALRELGWIRFRLPERGRQTEKVWAHEFGFTVASAMWGFHIGLGFTTYVKYGGFWVLVAMILSSENPVYGALVMLLYWFGRATPVWIAPLIQETHDGGELIEGILASRSLFNRAEALTLMLSAGIAVTWILAFLKGGSFRVAP